MKEKEIKEELSYLEEMRMIYPQDFTLWRMENKYKKVLELRNRKKMYNLKRKRNGLQEKV